LSTEKILPISDELGLAPEPGSTDSRDAAELQQFGYAQQLRRTMGGFSSFALSFSLISIITGTFANFKHGLEQAGPAVLWTWVIAVLGQLLVALVVAELATRYPLTGYGYQWASRLVNPHFGFFVGWMLLLQFGTGFPGICFTLGSYLQSFLHFEQYLPPDWGWTGEQLVPWITVGIMTVIALIHLAGLKLAALVNDFGVLAEIVGVAFLTIMLWWYFGGSHPEGWKWLLDRTSYPSGEPAGFTGMAMSLLLGAWCITGFEAAADLAEETHQPRHTLPRAIVMSELSAGIAGFFMLAGFLWAIDDLPAIQGSESPLLEILQRRFGEGVTLAAMILVYVSIFVCGVASLAHMTRLIFALARDNMLPMSRWLRIVKADSHTPVGAIIGLWLGASALVLLVRRMDAIIAISTITGYLGYAGIVWTSLAATQLPRLVSGGFGLGRWRGAVGWSALVWTLLLVVAVSVPQGSAGWLPLELTGVSAVVGIVLYVLLIRGRLRRGEAGPPIETEPKIDVQDMANEARIP
jgi:amino acid transporter